MQVFAGGELDTTEAVVDRAPQGELPNVTVDQGAKWLVDRLEIKGRGVVECTGGRIEPRDPNATGEIVVGSLPPGTARLRLTVMATHEDRHIEWALQALADARTQVAA